MTHVRFCLISQHCTTDGNWRASRRYTNRPTFCFSSHKIYIHCYSSYLLGLVNKFLNFCVACFPCWFLKIAIYDFSQPFSSCCICVNSGFPNFSSNDVSHIGFSWNKVVCDDSAGPTNVASSERAWEPLIYLYSRNEQRL